MFSAKFFGNVQKVSHGDNLTAVAHNCPSHIKPEASLKAEFAKEAVELSVEVCRSRGSGILGRYAAGIDFVSS